MTTNSVINKGIKSLEVVIRNELIDIFNSEVIPTIKTMIMDSFRNNLNGIVKGDYDNLKPEASEDLVLNRLDSFAYIQETIDGICLTVPGQTSLDFERGMPLVGAILEGLPNNYFKIKSSEYLKIFGGEVDSNNSYLIDEKNLISKGVDISKLDKFEFSNTPPIDITEEASLYVKSNMKVWGNRALLKAKLVMSNYAKGIK